MVLKLSIKEEKHLLKQYPVEVCFYAPITSIRLYILKTSSKYVSRPQKKKLENCEQKSSDNFPRFIVISCCCIGGIPFSETEYHCGRRIVATSEVTSGTIVSKQYPTKYVADTICDWEIEVHPHHKVYKFM